MNELEKWHADGVMGLRFPEVAQSEAEAGGNARRIQKAREYWAPLVAITNDEEVKRCAKSKKLFSATDHCRSRT
jgi:hypothetical protein